MQAEVVDPATMPPTVVIFGATGFIGRNLVRRLIGKVQRILPVSTSGTEVDGMPGFTVDQLEHVDIEAGAVAVNLAAHRYDAVDFTRTQSEILLRNIELAGMVYDFCLRKGITEIRSASSVAVYPARDDAFDDATEIDFNGHPHDGEIMYGWSKRISELYAELFARSCSLNTVTFRLTNPFGPYDSIDEAKAHVVPAFVIRALQTTGPFRIRGSPDASRDFIYVGDVCEVIARSLSWRGRNDTFNLGSGENITIGALAGMVLRLVGADREIAAAGKPTSAVSVRRCKNDRLRAAFGIQEFTSVEDGLAATIAWYRDALAKRA